MSDTPLSTLSPGSSALISHGMRFGGSSSRGRLNHLPEILDKSVTELELQPRAGVRGARPAGLAVPALG